MFDFFFDTGDIDYIKKLWDKLYPTIDKSHIRGITTNPNAFKKIDMLRLNEWEAQLPKLCELVSDLRGDSFGVVYVQAPYSGMSPDEVIRWASHIHQFSDGNTELGLKIPPFYPILEIVNELNEFMEVNVTGVADCSTALSCFTYDVKYVSLIPGRMEERGIDAFAHIAFAQRRSSSFSEIISGSMRTIDGLRMVCEAGTIPTIGAGVWDQLVDPAKFNLEDLLEFNKLEIVHNKFSPLILEDNIKLSIEFFNQMDSCGKFAYKDFGELK